eukprot:6189046-Pleurochrysis_carterae.AAC.2
MMALPQLCSSRQTMKAHSSQVAAAVVASQRVTSAQQVGAAPCKPKILDRWMKRHEKDAQGETKHT